MGILGDQNITRERVCADEEVIWSISKKRKSDSNKTETNEWPA